MNSVIFRCISKSFIPGLQRVLPKSLIAPKFVSWHRLRKCVILGNTPVLLCVTLLKENHRSDDEEDDIDQILEEADSYHEHNQVNEAWIALQNFTSTKEPELLWRIARVLAEKAKRIKDKKEKLKLYNEALKFIKKAIDSESSHGCSEAHKWYAIIINYVGELEGMKSHIKKSYEVKNHLERALEINPNDAIARMILGFWHFTFADLPYYQRLTAKAIFGTPPSSTYQEALKHFHYVEAQKPGYYKPNSYFLGETYSRMGKKDKAIEFYKKAFYAPTRTKDDENFHRMVLIRLKENGLNDSDL